MADYSLYNARINQYGHTKRDRVINKEKEYLYRKLSDHPSSKVVSINDEERLLVIISTDNANIKKIISIPEESFNSGDVVEYKSGKWIITESDIDDEIQTKGKMTLCPNTLQFQSKDGTILSYPYYVESSLPSLDQNKVLSTSDTTRKIVLPLDKETKQFHLDKRFLGQVFNGIPQCWMITELDAESKKGLLIVTLEKDEYHSDKDNLELGIADYFEPVSPPPQPTIGNCEITYLGLPEVKIGGSKKTFNAHFYDSNGNELYDVTAIWDVVMLPEFEQYFDIQSNGNLLSIKAANNLAIMDSNIKIILNDNNATYHTELLVRVVSGI